MSSRLSRYSSATPTTRTSRGSRLTCATRPTCWPAAISPGPRSARRSSSTTSTPPASNSPPTTPPSPTGSASVASSGSKHPSGAGAAGGSAAGGDAVGAVPARRPLIGLTTYRERAVTGVWDTEFALLHNVYVDAVALAGGVPVLLPPQEHGADEATEGVDALVLTGGSDVDPERYQQRPHQETTVVRRGRDEGERPLLARALAAALPVLGVCRGAQLLNVALGGTLDQHIPDSVGHRRHG